MSPRARHGRSQVTAQRASTDTRQARRAAADARAGRRWELAAAWASLLRPRRVSQDGEVEGDTDELPDGWEVDLEDPDARAADPSDADDLAETVPTRLAALSFWPDGGSLDVEVVAESALEDAPELLRVEIARHLSTVADLGEALRREQQDALRAPSLTSAFASLRAMTQADLAAAAGTSDATVSKLSDLIVETPAWRAPLGFFCWRADPSLVERLIAVAKALADDPGAPNTAIAERVATASSTYRRNTLRQDIAAIRTALRSSASIEAHRRRFPDVDEAALREELGLSGGRGRTMSRLLLLGIVSSDGERRS